MAYCIFDKNHTLRIKIRLRPSHLPQNIKLSFRWKDMILTYDRLWIRNLLLKERFNHVLFMIYFWASVLGLEIRTLSSKLKELAGSWKNFITRTRLTSLCFISLSTYRTPERGKRWHKNKVVQQKEFKFFFHEKQKKNFKNYKLLWKLVMMNSVS